MSLKDHRKPLFAGVLIVFACLGLARFAFGMIVPDMQRDLGMNATQTGIVGSANFIGYFAGLFLVSRFYARFGAAVLIGRALMTQAVSMVMMAWMPHYLWAALSFVVTGFFGALANIAVMSYIAQVVPVSMKGKATGVVVAGIGLAIITSAFIVPWVQLEWAYGWRVSWALFAGMIALIAFGTQPVLQRYRVQTHASSATSSLGFSNILSYPPFWHTGILFALFGMTAIMYMTFFVATAVHKWHVSTEISGTFWGILGVSSLFSGPFFGMLSDRLGRYKTLAIVFSLQCLSHGLLFLPIPQAWLFVSAVLFGFSTWAVPSIMATLSSELFGPAHTARILSLVTLFFGVGQMIGPLIAGMLIDASGDFGIAFGISALVLVIATLVSLYAAKLKALF